MRTRFFNLFLIAVLSLTAACLFPMSPATQSLLAAPGIAALGGAVFQLMRDHDAHLRAIELQGQANGFHVAAQSHMAKTVFDKHIAFAEEYSNAVLGIVDTLHREGPMGELIDISSLQGVRRQYVLWISVDLAKQLNSFEGAIVAMGSYMRLWNQTDQKERLPADLIEKVFAQFDALTMHSPKIEAGSDMKTRSYLHVLYALQELLGVEKLTQLRQEAINAAPGSDRSGR